MNYEQVEIRPFQSSDQAATKQLILNGLADHWETIDPTLNPDLNDIASSYQGETFLLAIMGGKIVGCGALIIEDGERGYGRIVRMSVKKENQRQGVGKFILQQLETAAKQRGFTKIVLETTQTWEKAIAFYLTNCYQILEDKDGDTHFEKHF